MIQKFLIPLPEKRQKHFNFSSFPKNKNKTLTTTPPPKKAQLDFHGRCRSASLNKHAKIGRVAVDVVVDVVV